MRRRYVLSLVALVVALGLLYGFKVRRAGTGPGAGPPVAADHFLFVHLNGKAVRESAPFADFRAALAKGGDAAAAWEAIDASTLDDIGVRLTEIEALTACAPEADQSTFPPFILIVTATKPIDRARAARFGAGAGAPDARGLIPVGNYSAHFPDANTAVLLHPSLAEKYLEGFAKDRTGWPFTAAALRTADTAALYVSANLTKLPQPPHRTEFPFLFEPTRARTVALSATFNGRELGATARATYGSRSEATAAKDKWQEVLADASATVKGRRAPYAGALAPLFAEAERALAAGRVEARGPVLTASATYTADFDAGAALCEAAVQMRAAANRMKASNNPKQIGLALHNYYDSVGVIPVFGTGPKGVPLKGAPNEKALLSWRVAVLPYLEQDALYRQFKLNEPWDGDHNKKLIDKMPAVFAPVSKPGKPGHTHFQMVIGPGGTPVGARIPNSFPDGTSNTLAVVEAADPVIWTKPADLEVPLKYAPGELKKRFGGEFPGGFLACFWDGSVRFVSLGASERTLGLMCHPSDGAVLPSDAFTKK